MCSSVIFVVNFKTNVAFRERLQRKCNERANIATFQGESAELKGPRHSRRTLCRGNGITRDRRMRDLVGDVLSGVPDASETFQKSPRLSLERSDCIRGERDL